MDTVPISGVDELDRHLDDLMRDPELPLQPGLFDAVELQLSEANIPPLIPRFLPKITTILTNYTKDPAVLTSLTIKLLGPVAFTQVLSLASEDMLVQALSSPAPSANVLAMVIIHKAASTPSDAAILSVMTPLFTAFLTRWLAAPDVEVGTKGGRVLGDLLDVDCELPPPPPPPRAADADKQLVLRRVAGQGKLWRRLFQDRDVYSLLVSLVSSSPRRADMSAHQLTLAQGRLLRVLPRLAALNFAAVSGSGLLQFAALNMVDKTDTLMHLSLVDFFEALVSVMRVAEYSPQKVEPCARYSAKRPPTTPC